MIYRNRADIIGILGADPEINYTQSGTAVAKLRIATTEHFKDQQSGSSREITDWHSVECWGKAAENAASYLRKGDQVSVEGRIKTERFTGTDGIERYATKIVAESIKYGSKGPASRAERSSYAKHPQQAAPQRTQPQAAPAQPANRGGSYPPPRKGGQTNRQQQPTYPEDGFLPPGVVGF